MGGDRGRDEQTRHRATVRGARAAVLSRIRYWQHSHLVRRLQAADVINQGLLLAAVLLLSFLPVLLVLESVAGRNDASGFVSRFGLTGEAALGVRQALTSPTAPSTAVSGLSWVFTILFGMAAAGAIQELYQRVFEMKGRGFRDTPRRAVWLAAALGVTFVGAWTQPWLDRVGGAGLVSIASLPAATAFWWFSMWLLLAGRLGWRDLFPSALSTGICWLGMVIVFRLTLSSSIASDYRKYGPVGVVFAIMTLLIAIGVVIILGAILGVAWQERREHPPGEQPGSRAGRGGLLIALSVGVSGRRVRRGRAGRRRLVWVCPLRAARHRGVPETQEHGERRAQPGVDIPDKLPCPRDPEDDRGDKRVTDRVRQTSPRPAERTDSSCGQLGPEDRQQDEQQADLLSLLPLGGIAGPDRARRSGREEDADDAEDERRHCDVGARNESEQRDCQGIGEGENRRGCADLVDDPRPQQLVAVRSHRHRHEEQPGQRASRAGDRHQQIAHARSQRDHRSTISLADQAPRWR